MCVLIFITNPSSTTPEFMLMEGLSESTLMLKAGCQGTNLVIRGLELPVLPLTSRKGKGLEVESIANSQ